MLAAHRIDVACCAALHQTNTACSATFCPSCCAPPAVGGLLPVVLPSVGLSSCACMLLVAAALCAPLCKSLIPRLPCPRPGLQLVSNLLEKLITQLGSFKLKSDYGQVLSALVQLGVTPDARFVAEVRCLPVCPRGLVRGPRTFAILVWPWLTPFSTCAAMHAPVTSWLPAGIRALITCTLCVLNSAHER